MTITHFRKTEAIYFRLTLLNKANMLKDFGKLDFRRAVSPGSCVRWAKPTGPRECAARVPTIEMTLPIHGGHGAHAPLPTLWSSPPHASDLFSARVGGQKRGLARASFIGAV